MDTRGDSLNKETSLDRKAAEKYLEKNDIVSRLRWTLNLQDWTIHIVWGHIPSSHGEHSVVAGNCNADPNYREATICLNNEVIEDKEKLLFVLRHEMLHIMISPFHLFHRQAGECMGEHAVEALRHAYTLGMELTIGNIERMLDQGLELNPKGMLKRLEKQK